MPVVHWITVLLVSATCLGVLSQNEAKFSKAANCFSINLMNKLKTPDGNLIMSGLSADAVLSMLSVGARGPTADELNEVLQYKANGLTGEDVKKEFHSALQRLASDNNVTLDIANALFVDKKFPINQDYKKAVEAAFLAKAEEADFSSQPHQSTETINKWVSEKTKKLIEKLFDEDLDATTVMVLLNAIYFKGQWLHKFETADTKTQAFFNGGDKNAVSMVPLMNLEREFAYKNDQTLKAQVLKMDYKGEKIGMVAVLPHEDVDTVEFEKNLNCEALNGLVNVQGLSKVNVTFPKFETTSDLDLVKPLDSLGLKKIFGGGDLSGLGQGGLKVTDVLQKARIKVNEEGSEAAAVTGAAVGYGAVMPTPPVQFLANRPFYYFIVENNSGLVLFAGKLNKL